MHLKTCGLVRLTEYVSYSLSPAGVSDVMYEYLLLLSICLCRIDNPSLRPPPMRTS